MVANVAVISGTTKDFPQKIHIIYTIRGVDKSAHPHLPRKPPTRGFQSAPKHILWKVQGDGFSLPSTLKYHPIPLLPDAA